MCVEDIATLTVFISLKTILNFRGKRYENSNLICLFRQDLKSLNHIYADHVGDDMTKEEFRKFCKNCWDNTQHGFIVIDLTSRKDNGKYRYGFDNFFIPNLK